MIGTNEQGQKMAHDAHFLLLFFIQAYLVYSAPLFMHACTWNSLSQFLLYRSIRLQLSIISLGEYILASIYNNNDSNILSSIYCILSIVLIFQRFYSNYLYLLRGKGGWRLLTDGRSHLQSHLCVYLYQWCIAAAELYRIASSRRVNATHTPSQSHATTRTRTHRSIKYFHQSTKNVAAAEATADRVDGAWRFCRHVCSECKLPIFQTMNYVLSWLLQNGFLLL